MAGFIGLGALNSLYAKEPVKTKHKVESVEFVMNEFDNILNFYGNAKKIDSLDDLKGVTPKYSAGLEKAFHEEYEDAKFVKDFFYNNVLKKRRMRNKSYTDILKIIMDYVKGVPDDPVRATGVAQMHNSLLFNDYLNMIKDPDRKKEFLKDPEYYKRLGIDKKSSLHGMLCRAKWEGLICTDRTNIVQGLVYVLSEDFPQLNNIYVTRGVEKRDPRSVSTDHMFNYIFIKDQNNQLLVMKFDGTTFK